MANVEKEFVLRHTFKQFSKLEKQSSPYQTHFGIPWCIKIGLLSKKTLTLDLYCNLILNSNLWKIEVQAQYGLISTNGGFLRYHDKDKQDIDTFAHRRALNGYETFAYFDDVNENCVKNDELTAEIRVKIVGMTGISRKKKKNFEEPHGKMSDACLVVNEKKFHVSKMMLAENSPVFEAMFFGDFVEAESKEVVIQDTKPDCFEVFLSLIYWTHTKITEENVAELLKLADRYDISRITEECEQFLLKANMEILQKLILSEEYLLPTVQKECLDRLTTKEELKNLEKNMNKMGEKTAKALFHKSLYL